MSIKNKEEKTKLKKECQLVFGLNELGMILFRCKTHGDADAKLVYKRLKTKCRNKIIKKFEEVFKRL